MFILRVVDDSSECNLFVRRTPLCRTWQLISPFVPSFPLEGKGKVFPLHDM
jgi:hypothetical protein